MITGYITTNDEQGNRVHNVRVLLMEGTDAEKITETFLAHIAVQEAMSVRFDSLEGVGNIHSEQIAKLLEVVKVQQDEIKRLDQEIANLQNAGRRLR